jgi:CelD/BcsL family acetyltransferase involved in cellulose biosynthesis
MRALDDRRRRYLTYVACRQEQVVAIGAFVRVDGRCCTLRLAGGTSPIDSYGLASMPGEEEAVVGILEAAAQAAHPIDRILLHGAPHPVVNSCRLLPMGRVSIRRNGRILAAFASDWGEYEREHLPSKYRRELGRQLRRLMAAGRVTLRREEHDVHDVLMTLGRLHILRAADRHCRSPFGRGSLHYLRAQIETAARNRSLAAYILALDGQPIAAVLSFELGGSSAITHLAFDQAYRSYGPGTLLLRHMMEDIVGRGIRVLDFGIGELPYKRRLGNRSEPWYLVSASTGGLGSGLRSVVTQTSERLWAMASRVEAARAVRLQIAGGARRQLRFLESEVRVSPPPP